MRTVRTRRGVIVLGAAIAAYPVVPMGETRSVLYDALGLLCVLHGYLGLRRDHSNGHRSWLLVLGGFVGWVVGDAMFTVEQDVFHLSVSPAPSDAVYITSYGLLGLGLLHMALGRRTERDVTPLLDAAIVAVGAGVLAAVFVISPIAHDSTLDAAGKITASAYPVADLFLLGVLVRLWAAPGARTAAFHLLLASLCSTLVADIAWNILAITSPGKDSAAWTDMFWLASYLLVAAAVREPSMRLISEPVPARGDSIDPQRRLAALACGLLLPGVALLIAGVAGGPVPWLVVSIGSVVLSGLVLARMATLLRVVQIQAVQLAALARCDALTGAPNRRTWDHELGRACQHARENGSDLAVAIVDLDHFKRYNDLHGHQAGDLLLREAVAAWSELLLPGELLARYGGEEFALLLPGVSALQAAERLERMRKLTPRGQAYSAGVAVWDPRTEPAAVVGAADRALYDAKRGGRDRVRIAQASATDESVPALKVVLQPIVDLADGGTVAHEALSRFEGHEPEQVFAEAHRTGSGPELEAAAIRAALESRPVAGLLTLNVSIEALLSRQVLDSLPEDLTGLVIEITEHQDVERWSEVTAVVERLRERGAMIAVDDWGQGYSTLDRLLRLRPHVVKLDLALVQALDSPLHRAAIRSVAAWAREVGVVVCAEGVETEEQWHQLRELGVQLGQGFLFGRPSAPDTDGAGDGLVAALSPAG